MKTLAIFVLISTIFSLRVSQTDSKLVLTPGVGFSELRIGQKSPKEELSFRNYTFSKSDGMSLACGPNISLNHYWESFYCEEVGLTVEFNSESFPEGTKPKSKELFLTKISVYPKGNSSCTTNDLCVGKTTYSDVAKTYGPIPSHWKNESYLKFDDRGIAFRFDKQSTLIGIEIIEPENEKN